MLSGLRTLIQIGHADSVRASDGRLPRQRLSYTLVIMPGLKQQRAPMMAPFPIRDPIQDGSEFIVERCSAEVRGGLGVDAGSTGVGTAEVEVDVKILCANAPLWSQRILNARTSRPANARSFGRLSRHRRFYASVGGAAGPGGINQEAEAPLVAPNQGSLISVVFLNEVRSKSVSRPSTKVPNCLLAPT